MNIIEVSGNLFLPEKWYRGENVENLYFAHCIASDFGMYGGIAKQFVQRLDMKRKLFDWAYENNLIDEVSKNPAAEIYAHSIPTLVGKAVLIEHTYNLITKEYTAEKPTQDNLTSSLRHMKSQMGRSCDLAIPDMIGCGIDELNRDVVMATLQAVFLMTAGNLYVVKLD